MTGRTVVAVAWSCWGVLMLLCLYGLFKVSTERSHSPEATRGLGIFVLGLGLVALLAAGGLLYYFARKGSTGGVVTLALVLAYPLVMLVASPAIGFFKKWSFERELAKTGAFRDPSLQAMAEAVRANDAVTLARLLDHKPPPAGTDAAGNDLLGYAVQQVVDGKPGTPVVRALLEAGADPRKARLEDGGDVLNRVVVGSSPDTAEVVRLLLAHGADPNAVNPNGGETPIRNIYDKPDVARALIEGGADLDRIQPDGCNALVHFVSTRQWETAILMVEKGARLDVVNEHGLSLDYYLKDWKESVYGEHPEGWDRLREAIRQRREGH